MDSRGRSTWGSGRSPIDAAESCFGTREWPEDIPVPQAKCYNANYPVKKADVDSFLSESVHKLIGIATPADPIPTLARLQTQQSTSIKVLDDAVDRCSLVPAEHHEMAGVALGDRRSRV